MQRAASLRDGGPQLIALADGSTFDALNSPDRVRLAHALVKIGNQPSAARGLARIVDSATPADEFKQYASQVALTGLAQAQTKEAVGILLRTARGSARDLVLEAWSACPPRDPAWLVDAAPPSLAVAAARSGDLRALEWLSTRVNQLSGDVLAEALTTMAELGDERAIDVAKESLVGIPHVRAAATMVLIAFKDKDAHAQLKLLLQDLSTRGAAFEIATRAHLTEILPFALQIDLGEDLSTSTQRIAYLKSIGGREAVNAIGKLLSHDIALVREAAARALGVLHTRDSGAVLSKEATSKSLFPRRIAAFFGYALHRQNGGEMSPAIEQELQKMLTSPREDEREVAVRTRGESGGELPWFDLAQDKSINVRLELALVLSKRGPLDVLRKWTKDEKNLELAKVAMLARMLRFDPELSLKEVESAPPNPWSAFFSRYKTVPSSCHIGEAELAVRALRIATVFGCIANGSRQAKRELLAHLAVEPDARLRFAILRGTKGARGFHEAMANATRDPDRRIRAWAKFGTMPPSEATTFEGTGAGASLSLSFQGIAFSTLFAPFAEEQKSAEPVLEDVHDDR